MHAMIWLKNAQRCTYPQPRGLFGVTDGTEYGEATSSPSACSQLTEGHMVEIAWLRKLHQEEGMFGWVLLLCFIPWGLAKSKVAPAAVQPTPAPVRFTDER